MKSEILATTRNGGVIIGQTWLGLVDHAGGTCYVPPERVHLLPHKGVSNAATNV